MTLVPPPLVGAGQLNVGTTGFPAIIQPFPNITPFTYRDGLTWAETLEEYQRWILTALVPHVDSQSLSIADAYNAASQALASAMSDYKISIKADQDAFKAATLAQQTTFESYVNGVKNNVDASKAAAAASATAADASADEAEMWNASTEAIQDDAISTLIGKNDSKTSQAIRGFRGGSIYIEQFFPAGRVPGDNDTAAFQAAVDASENRVLILGNNVLKITQDVELAKNNVTIDARSSTINAIDNGTAAGVSVHVNNCSGFTWIGGEITQNAATRSGVYGLMFLENVDTFNINQLSTEGGSSAGIFALGCSNGVIDAPRVSNSQADGIHITRGSVDVIVNNPVVIGAGDDAVAVVAVTTEPSKPEITYDICQRITVNNPIVSGQTKVGGCVSFVGAKYCTLNGGILRGSPTSGIKITSDNLAGAPQSAQFITITGSVVQESVSHGVIVGVAEDISLVNVLSVNNADAGIASIGAKRMLIQGGIYRNNGFGYYEAPKTNDALDADLNHIIGSDMRANTVGPYRLSDIKPTVVTEVIS